MPSRPANYHWLPASNAVALNPKPVTVRIYIDNSNLWKQGQKTYAQNNKLSSSWDPLWRINFEGLRGILMRESQLGPSTSDYDVQPRLYASEPPPVDSLWARIRSREVHVSTFARSSWTQKEKQVDHEIIADAVEQASEDYYNYLDTEYIIVSGDRDIYSAVMRIMKRGFPVHVWAWKNCLANVYKESAEEEKLLHIYYLDDYLEEVGFRETTFRPDRYVINPHSIVVLDPLPKSNDIKAFVDELDTPVWLYEKPKKRPGVNSPDLVIIPAIAEWLKHHHLVSIFQTAKTKLAQYDLKVMTYSEYCQTFFKESRCDELVVSNRFDELSGQKEHVERKNKENKPKESYSLYPKQNTSGPAKLQLDPKYNSDDENGFSPAKNRQKRRKVVALSLYRKALQRCKWGLYCPMGNNCKNGHTKEHEIYFNTYGTKKPRKYRLCWHENCTLGRKLCGFAHGMDDLLCPTCGKIGAGHEMENCNLNDL